MQLWGVNIQSLCTDVLLLLFRICGHHLTLLVLSFKVCIWTETSESFLNIQLFTDLVAEHTVVIKNAAEEEVGGEGYRRRALRGRRLPETGNANV